MSVVSVECIGEVSYLPIIPSLEDAEAHDNFFIHKSTSHKSSTILFDPVIKSGIVQFEILNIKDT